MAADGGEVLSLEEINERFDSEWVLVEDPKTTRWNEVIRGKVLWHSPDRDDVYRKALELRPRHSAILFTGTVPDDVVIVL